MKTSWMKHVLAGAALLSAMAWGRSARAQATDETKACRSAAVAAHIMLGPGDIKWEDGPPSLPPGAKIAVIEGDPKAANQLVTFRLKLPPGYKIPPHWHPADEHVTVVSGKLLMGMGDTFDASKLKPFPAGSFLVMPAKSTHFPTVKTETVIQVHAIGPWSIIYVNAADDPRQAKKGVP
jgi:quercetin dioxygenase-like cupin family protein